jgi:cation transport protein ChaC
MTDQMPRRTSPVTAEPVNATGDPFWVFGYGSLMWQPAFPYEEVQPALLHGYHRAFCVYSCHYRGTPEEPGLVLGLARGGSCRGLAFRVNPSAAAAVKSYLDERELIGYAYVARTVRVVTPSSAVAAYTFVADPTHSLYAGDLGIERSATIIMRARGATGLNREYLINTVRQIEAEGFVDRKLHALLARVAYLTGIVEAGGGI